MTPEPLACVICGDTPWQQGNVAMALIRWRDGDKRYGSGPRCKDVVACRRRVEANDEAWPLIDAGSPTAFQLQRFREEAVLS